MSQGIPAVQSSKTHDSKMHQTLLQLRDHSKVTLRNPGFDLYSALQRYNDPYTGKTKKGQAKPKEKKKRLVLFGTGPLPEKQKAVGIPDMVDKIFVTDGNRSD